MAVPNFTSNLAPGVRFTAGGGATGTPGQQYLNTLDVISRDGSRGDEYAQWQQQTGGKIDWNSPELRAVIEQAKTDPQARQYLSQWAHTNPIFGQDQALKDIGIDTSGYWASRQPNAAGGFSGVQGAGYTSPGLLGGVPQTNAQRPASPTSGAVGGMSGGMMGRPFTPDASTGGSGGGMGGGLVQDVNVNQYNQNPYLQQMGTVLTNRVTDNLSRNIMPSIRSNAVMAGGFGGSRQGVVEANAMRDANQTISDALTGAYFQDFTNQMNRNLQQYGQNQGFYSNQRGQDLQQTALGADLFQRGNQGFLGQGQGIYGLGTTQQQAPWQVVNNANAGLGQWSGYGTTTQAGGGAQGMLGGALAGGQLGNLWGGVGAGTAAPNVGSNWSLMNPTAAPWSLGQSTGGNGAFV